MPSLPDLTYKELIALLKHFGCTFRGEGSPRLVGLARDGTPFTVHHHPSKKVHKAELAKILKYIRVSQDEFWFWYHS